MDEFNKTIALLTGCCAQELRVLHYLKWTAVILSHVSLSIVRFTENLSFKYDVVHRWVLGQVIAHAVQVVVEALVSDRE